MKCSHCHGTGEIFDIAPGDVYLETTPGVRFCRGAVFVVLRVAGQHVDFMYGPNKQGQSTNPAWIASDIESRLTRIHKAER